MAVQILDYIGWAPECATHNHLNVPKLLPPKRAALIQLGYREHNGGAQTRGDFYSQLAVYTAVTKIEDKGLTASVLIHKNGIVLRSGELHGVVLGEVPTCLQEVAVPHSLRIVRDWFHQATQKETKEIREVVVMAGDIATVTAVRRWFGTGELTLESAAISPLADDLHRLGDWLHVPVRIYPYDPPTDRRPHEMPWVHRAISTQMGEFRQLLEEQKRGKEDQRGRDIPRVP